MTFGVCKCLPELGLFVLRKFTSNILFLKEVTGKYASFTQLSLQFRVSAFCKEMKHTQLLEGDPMLLYPVLKQCIYYVSPQEEHWVPLIAQTPLATLEL